MLQADPLSPGLRLGRYELIQRLAVGGMAEIYLARATGIEGFEKLVVLKRILPQYASSESFVTMFLDEARLSATLQHPNIAQVHDIGQYDSSYFFTMEYVRGEDVRTILKTAVKESKRIPLSHCVKIIADACAGLHAAHEKRGNDGQPLNIIHRDVSPSNVIVSYDGAVKLLDFGVAKAAQRQAETRSGTLKGKVSYMSPEQCRGKELDRRSDVFALGILLYELTLRRRLFNGGSEFEIMTRIVKEDVPPPSKTFPKYPKQLELILMKALRRNRDERYATAQEMQLDLEDFATRNRLHLSNVRLGRFMSEMFVERMRKIDSAITRRPSTEELVGANDSGSFPEVEIDTGDGVHPTKIESGLAKRRAETEAPVGDEPSQVSATPAGSGTSEPSPANDEEPVAEPSVASQPSIASASQVSTPSQIVIAPRSQWPMVIIAAIAAAAAVFIFVGQRGGTTNTDNKNDSSTQRPGTPTRASLPSPTSPQAQPKAPVQTKPEQATAAPNSKTNPPVQRSLVTTPAATKTSTTSKDATSKDATAKDATKSATSKATTTTAKKAVKKIRRRPRRRYTRRRVVKRKSKKPTPKTKKRSWQLDSPLPPPR